MTAHVDEYGASTADEGITGHVYVRADRRVACMPTDSLEPDIWQQAYESVLEIMEARRCVDEAISNARAVLHEMISRLPIGSMHRKPLIKARRALVGMTLQREIPLPSGIDDGGKVYPLVADIRDQLKRVGRLVATSETALDEARANALTAVVQQLNTPFVRHGIAVSAPSMLPLIPRIASEPNAADEKIAMRASTFISRATTKTSPFATFTVTEPVNLSLPRVEGFPTQLQPVVQADGRLWSLLLESLVGDHQAWHKLEVTFNPSLTWSEEQSLFLGKLPQETLGGFRRNSLVDILREAPLGLRTLAAWTDYLAQEGMADRADGNGHEAIAGIVEAGLLTIQVPVAESSLAPFRDVARLLEGMPYFTDLTQACNELQDALEARTPLDGQVADTARLHRIRLATIHLHTLLKDRFQGRKMFELGDMVHENVVSSGVDPEFSDYLTDDIDPTYGDLREVPTVALWMSQFDTKLPGRLVVADWAEREIGYGSVPLLDFYRRVNSALLSEPDNHTRNLQRFFNAIPVQPEQSTFEVSGRLAELVDIRNNSRALVEGNAASTDVRISLDVIAEQVSAWPSWLNQRAAYGIYLQPLTDADQKPTGQIINSMHGGFGRGRARTEQMLRNVDSRRPVFRVAPPPDVTTAGYSGSQGSSLNLHGMTTEKLIHYPYTHFDGSESQRIPLGRIGVRLEQQELQLFDTLDGKAILPVHVGMLADYQLPPMARFLERIFGRAAFLHPSSPPLASAIKFGELQTIQKVPRVTLGSTVVQRKRWIVPVDLFQGRDAKSPRDQWEAFIQLFSTGGIPHSVYARAWGSDLRRDKAKSRKPIHIDIRSWWSVKEFLRHAGGADFFVFDESLPDPMSGARRHVEEYLVEMIYSPNAYERARESSL